MLLAVVAYSVTTLHSQGSLVPERNSGYSLSEKQALRDSYPNLDGQVVYYKTFDNNKLIVWETDNGNYVKLVETKLGLDFCQ
jgi:hypothetical protein